MLWSQTFIPTLKETPADAEIVSHQLLLRAGLVRKLTGGLYTFLPLGLKVLRKIEQIIREELSVRDVESLVKAKKNGQTLGLSLSGTDWDPEIDRITAAFYEKLRTAVHLKASGKGKGKIIISYKSREDLERILGLIGQ